MNKTLKKSFFLFLTTSIVLSSFILPLSSCGYLISHDDTSGGTNQGDNNLYDPPLIGDSNTDGQTNGNSDNSETIIKGELSKVVDEKIKEIKSQNIEIINVDSNQFGLLSSKEDFISNLDIWDKNKYSKFNIQNIEYDVYSFIKQIYLSAQSELDVRLASELNIEIINDSSNKVEKIGISFVLEIKNRQEKAKEYNIGNKSIIIPSSEKQKINVVIPRQTLKFDLSKKDNFLQPTFDNVSFDYENDKTKSFVTSNFKFIPNTISYTSPFKIIGIFNEHEGFENEKKFDLKNLNSKDVQSGIENYFVNTQNEMIEYLQLSSSLIDQISKNIRVNEFLQISSTYIADLLVKTNIITESLKPMIIDLFNKDLSLVTVIDKHTKAISEFISTLLSTPLEIPPDVIETILEPIGPNMSKDDIQNLLDLINLFESVLPENITTLIKEIVLNLLSGKDIYKFIDFILENVLSEIGDIIPMNQLAMNIIEFVKYVFKKDYNGEYPQIMDVITQNNDLLFQLIKSIIGIGGVGNVANIFDQFFTKNQNYTQDNVIKIINNLVKPTINFFSNKNNYSIKSGYFIDLDNNKSFKYNSNNQTVSFEYSLKFIFNKNLKIDLSILYDILPDRLDINSQYVPLFLVKSLIPQYIEIGANDSLEIQFSALNQTLDLKPIKVLNNLGYYFNYNIPYKANVKFDMPYVFNSIFTQRKRNFFLWDLWVDAISMFAMVEYNFYGVASISDKQYVNVNYIDKIPKIENTFKWNDLNNTQIQSLKQYIENRDSLTFKVRDQNRELHTISGSKPYLIESKKQELMDMLFTFGDGIKSLPKQLQPYILIEPHVNGQINLLGNKASLTIIQIDIYFPDNRIIDLNNSNLDTKNYVYNNHYSKTITLA